MQQKWTLAATFFYWLQLKVPLIGLLGTLLTKRGSPKSATSINWDIHQLPSNAHHETNVISGTDFLLINVKPWMIVNPSCNPSRKGPGMMRRNSYPYLVLPQMFFLLSIHSSLQWCLPGPPLGLSEKMGIEWLVFDFSCGVYVWLSFDLHCYCVSSSLLLGRES